MTAESLAEHGDGTPAAATRLISLNVFYEELTLGAAFATAGRTVTETDIVQFSGLSGDHSPLHTDEVASREGPFGARVAHGCLTLSIATGLEYALMGPASHGDAILGFYGMDRVRFVKPVFIGDTIRLEGEVVAREERGDEKGVVTFHMEVVNQDAVPVAVFDKKLLYKRRAPEVRT